MKKCHCFQEVYIRYSPLRHIHDNAFKGLRNLKVLSITKSDLIAPPSLNFISHTLTQLTLSDNNISEIPNEYLDDCRDLETIIVSLSKIAGLCRMNSINDQLRDLDLSANEIVDIRHLYGVVFLKLRVLQLDRNQITSIEAHFLVLPVAEYITLTENRLSEMPDLIQSTWGNELPKNRHVIVEISHGNPWHCSARMLWVIDLNSPVDSEATKLKHRVKIIDLERMVCHTPADVDWEIITDVSKCFSPCAKARSTTVSSKQIKAHCGSWAIFRSMYTKWMRKWPKD